MHISATLCKEIEFCLIKFKILYLQRYVTLVDLEIQVQLHVEKDLYKYHKQRDPIYNT